RAVEGGTRLHGSVTTVDIADAIREQAGREINRRDIDLRQPIRSLGDYQVNLKLVRGVTVPIQVTIAEHEPGEEPAPTEAAAAPPKPEAAPQPEAVAAEPEAAAAQAEAAAPEPEAAVPEPEAAADESEPPEAAPAE